MLRLDDLPGYIRSLGYSPELTLSKTMQATPMRHRGRHVGNFFLGEKAAGQTVEITAGLVPEVRVACEDGWHP